MLWCKARNKIAFLHVEACVRPACPPLRPQVLEEQLGRRGEAVAPLEPMLYRTLADIQERLTYRAQVGQAGGPGKRAGGRWAPPLLGAGAGRQHLQPQAALLQAGPLLWLSMHAYTHAARVCTHGHAVLKAGRLQSDALARLLACLASPGLAAPCCRPISARRWWVLRPSLRTWTTLRSSRRRRQQQRRPAVMRAQRRRAAARQRAWRAAR